MNILKFRKEWIPNYISVFRGLLVPLFAVFFFMKERFGDDRFFIAGAVFLTAGASDLLDGYLARKNNWITDFGKLLDPFCDKMMELVVTVSFAIELGQGFLVLAAFVVLKEVIMICGSFVIMTKSKLYLPSTWYGKVATFGWYILMFLVTFIPPVRGLPVLYNVLCGVLVGLMIFTFFSYCMYYKDAILKTFRSGNEKSGNSK